MVFPHLALKNHHIFRSIPMCVTDFTGPATFPGVQEEIMAPAHVCALFGGAREPCRGETRGLMQQQNAAVSL